MSFGANVWSGDRPNKLAVANDDNWNKNSNPSPRNFSPKTNTAASPKLCAVSGCPKKRFVRGYCATCAQKRDHAKTIAANTPKSRGPASPAPRASKYPVNRDNEVFRNVHKAWLDGWDSFVARVKNPYSIPAGTTHSYSRQVLELIMRICEYVPAVISSPEWASREQSMAGKQAQEVIMHWGGMVSHHLNESIVIMDDTALKLLVMCILNFHTPGANKIPNGPAKEPTPVINSIRLNRNMCAQILSSLSMNLTNAKKLYDLGIVNACQNQFKDQINFEDEDMTCQSLLHFLIQGSYIWKTMKADDYQARETARSVYQCVSAVLETSSQNRNASINAKGRALMTVLVRISPHRCQDHCIEHTRALYEVPKLLGKITHWFYERHVMSESFDDVVSEVIRDIIQNTQSLPTFLQNTMKKALSFGKECIVCKRVAPNLPMVARCSCKQCFYCSKACQSEHWAEHKSECKAAWQDDVLQTSAPVNFGANPGTGPGGGPGGTG